MADAATDLIADVLTARRDEPLAAAAEASDLGRPADVIDLLIAIRLVDR